MSSSVVSANATHVIGFTIGEVATPLGSIEIEFCSNDAIPGTPCVAPSGFDILGSTLSNQTGNTGFSVHPNTTANVMVLTRFPILPMGPRGANGKPTPLLGWRRRRHSKVAGGRHWPGPVRALLV